MEMRTVSFDNKNNEDDSIDDILEQLKSNRLKTEKSSSQNVDEILAKMGMEKETQRPIYDPDSPNSRVGGNAEKELSHDEKVAQSTAIFKALTKKDIEQAKSVSTPQRSVPVAKTPEVGNTQTTIKLESVEEKTDATQNRPERSRIERNRAERAAARKQQDRPNIMDVKVEHTSAGFSRVGKAGAFERVDREKFTKEKEFLSWFSEDDAETPSLSKKEQRRLRKEEKEQEKKALDLEEVAEKELFVEEPQEELFELEQDENDKDVYKPNYPKEITIETPAEREEAEQKKREISRKISKEDKVVTGSAFDLDGESEWPEEGSLFDHDKLVIPPEKPAPAGAKAQFYEITQNRGDFQRVSAAEKEKTSAQVKKEKQHQATKEIPKVDAVEENKSLFVDEMVNDRFRDFFSETVSVDRTEKPARKPSKFKMPKKNKTALLTGEFSKLATAAEEYSLNEEDSEFIDYNHIQEAPEIENDIASLKRTLLVRTGITAVITIILFWMSFAFSGVGSLPAFLSPATKPMAFGLVYVLLVIAAIIVNATTIAAGISGLFSAPSSDTAPALASFGALLQGVVLLVHLITKGELNFVLFGGISAMLFTFNTLGKYIRAGAIFENFQMASSQANHNAGFVLDDSRDVSYYITDGMQETQPSILLSRPTSLVKGFMRQSFSQRWSDRLGKKIGLGVLGVSILVALISYVQSKEVYLAVSALAATLCVAAPLSSTILAAIPSVILQKSTSKVGAVIPGWSAIEDLGEVNVVMIEAKDIFPSSSVSLNGIKTFGKTRIDTALLYAASLAIQRIDTMKEIFMSVIQNKSDMLFDVESVVFEPGRGYTAWMNNTRVMLGTRDMLKRHGVEPPSIEVEMSNIPDDCLPMYLAISGKLAAMFVVKYRADDEVVETLEGLVKSGISMLVTSNDMNITGNIIEIIYDLPPDTVKVLGERELSVLEPLTEYLPESDGVMTHEGTFASFIGGMRAAAGCASAEKMAGVLQLIAVIFACILSVLLAISGGLAGLSLVVVIIYQLAWTLMVAGIPFAKRY